MATHRFKQVTTYDRLQRHYRSWLEGHIAALAAVGKGGTGKTHLYEDMMSGQNYHLFRGRTSAITMYRDVKDNPKIPIIFDDIRGLLKDSACLDIMKQLCDSRATRVVRWNTEALDADERSFVCSSSVLVILNWIPRNDHDVDAILDRFDVIEFAPTKSEIIAKMRTFKGAHQADIDVIAEALVNPSLRTLKKFEGWKRSPHLNELEELYSDPECHVPKDVQTVIDIMAAHKRGMWVKTYRSITGKSYEAAKRDWTRKSKIAKQLLEARASN